MNLKHKLLSDYQFISDDKKITIIKSGTIIENYTCDKIVLDKVVVDSNPQYFEVFDWKSELILFMKKSKIPQPAILSKKLIPFINEIIKSSDREDSKEILEEYRIKIERLELDEKKYKENLKSNKLILDNEGITLEEKYKIIYNKLNMRDIELNMREESLNEYNDYLDLKIKDIEIWKNTVLNKWNYDLYPLPDFPIIKKRRF